MLGLGNVNQGKLEVVKEEMARVNVDILGISELKWIRMGEFNSDKGEKKRCIHLNAEFERIAHRHSSNVHV